MLVLAAFVPSLIYWITTRKGAEDVLTFWKNGMEAMFVLGTG